MKDAVENLELAEQMRQRDVLVQVERFLKYASRGTDPAVVRKEAAAWADRIEAFSGDHKDRARQLVRKLRAIAG